MPSRARVLALLCLLLGLRGSLPAGAGAQRPAPAPACQWVPGGAAARLAGAGVQGGALLLRGGPRDLPQRGED
ncbi:hypothetical protein FD755_015428, partial [Muntiacus reevesi]